MKTSIILFCMALRMGVVQAQLSNDMILDKTWKVNLMLNTSHEFVIATKQKTYINNDHMIVVPQCYRWDCYYKIISVNDETLVLEEYDYSHKHLTPTGNHVFFKRSSITEAEIEKMSDQERANYLRINR